MAAQTHIQADLIFTDDSAVSLARLSAPFGEAMRLFGENACGEIRSDFESVTVLSPNLTVSAKVIDGADAAEDETFRLRLELTRTRNCSPRRIDADAALLAEIVHHVLELTGAPFVTWLETPTRLPAARFQSAFVPIRLRGTAADADHAPGVPRRVRPGSTDAGERLSETALAEMKSRVAGADAPDEAPKAELAAIFRAEPILVQKVKRDLSVEHRVATWTVNGSIALLSPPAGAAVMTYNLLRGENFRLTTHALTLVAAFLGLGVHEVMAGTVGALPF